MAEAGPPIQTITVAVVVAFAVQSLPGHARDASPANAAATKEPIGQVPERRLAILSRRRRNTSATGSELQKSRRPKSAVKQPNHALTPIALIGTTTPRNAGFASKDCCGLRTRHGAGGQAGFSSQTLLKLLRSCPTDVSRRICGRFLRPTSRFDGVFVRMERRSG